MDNINIPLLPNELFPCLAIPFVELFPDLCLGWWTPPSLNLVQYKKLWYLRVSLLSIAMIPVFELLLPIIDDGPHFSLLVLGSAACVAIRTFTMNKELERVMKHPLWKEHNKSAPKDLFVVISRARPTDINKFDDMAARYVALPTKIAMAIMYGIVNSLSKQLGDEEKMKLLTAFAVFIVGGIGIGGTRHASTVLDCFFRCVFGAGFVAVLYYLAEVSDIVLIKSVS